MTQEDFKKHIKVNSYNFMDNGFISITYVNTLIPYGKRFVIGEKEYTSHEVHPQKRVTTVEIEYNDNPYNSLYYFLTKPKL